MSGFGLWLPWAFGFVAVSLSLLLWVYLTRRIGKSRRSRTVSGNIALVVFSTAYTLLIADLLVGIFLVQSDANGYTLAHKRWAAKYWFPTINSYGYRDYEPVWTDHVLFMVGASLTAGAGVERLEDRMSGVLARKLGPRWTVATVANPGWDSAAEFAALIAHPKTPNIIVLTYTPTDILGAAQKRGFHMPQVAIDPPAFFKPIVDHSFLANWLYWRFGTQGGFDKYWSYVRSAYASPEIFADHMADLVKFMRHAENIGAELYFVVWPSLMDLNGSEEIVVKVSHALQEQGAHVIDLLPHLKNRPLRELVVNAKDPHPSARAHALAAEVIFEHLSKNGLNGISRAHPEQPGELGLARPW